MKKSAQNVAFMDCMFQYCYFIIHNVYMKCYELEVGGFIDGSLSSDVCGCNTVMSCYPGS